MKQRNAPEPETEANEVRKEFMALGQTLLMHAQLGRRRGNTAAAEAALEWEKVVSQYLSSKTAQPA